MAQRQRVISGRIRSEHIVQLFDAPESRAAGVASFIEEALAQHRRVLAVVTQSHWWEIANELERRGVDVARGEANGALTVVDAARELSKVMRDDGPMHDLFRSNMATCVARLADTPNLPLHVYGEMVDLLAERGDFLSTMELEEYWNELAREHSLIILCAYSSAHFGPERSAPALHAICRAHSKVQTRISDPLGAWLTASVSHGSTPTL